jgi:hypothetical protein
MITYGQEVITGKKLTEKLSSRGGFFVQEAGREYEFRNLSFKNIPLIFVEVR